MIPRWLLVFMLLCLFRVLLTKSSNLERTMVSVFVEPNKYNLSCVLPTTAQQIWCLREAELQHVLDEAKHLAIESCRTAFEYEQWQCTTNKTSFRTGTRETAFLYAMYTAALTYSVSQACTHGRLVSCLCPAYTLSRSTKVCTDHIEYGSTFARSFLDIEKWDPLQYDNTATHNALIGLEVAVNSLKDECTCYGTSGSCYFKFCYKKLKSFLDIVETLKSHYHSATLWIPANTVKSRRLRKYAKRLLYSVPTALDCTTEGRVCLHRSHCDTLCCGRGFHTHYQLTHQYCRCSWTTYFNLHCDVCRHYKLTMTCK